MRKHSKLLFAILFVPFLFTTSCNSKTEQINTNDPKYQNYLLAQESGYSGTYEEWLESIKGKDGVSIVSVIKTDTKDNIDTYTISYSDGKTSTFTVTNGIDGRSIKGDTGSDGHTPVITIGDNGNWFVDNVDTNTKAQGVKGDNGVSILSVEKTDTKDNIDTYTITYSDNRTSTFTVTNGVDGRSIKGDTGEDGHTPVITIGDNGNWFVDNVDTNTKAQGVKGDSGLSAYELYKKHYPDYQGDEDQWMDDLINGKLGNKEKHKVNFYDGDKLISSQDVEHSSIIQKVNLEQKLGYIFDGWYTSEDEKWAFDIYAVFGDINLYSKYTKEDFEYELKDGKAYIKAYTGESTKIEIPSTSGGYEVVGIENNAFENCPITTTFIIPNTITSIGKDVFKNSQALTNFYYNGSIEDWCKIDLGNYYSNPMSRGEINFYFLNENGSIEYNNKKYNLLEDTIELSNSISEIKPYCFNSFRFKKVILPDSITAIGTCAFEYCYYLTSINIPNSVTSIGVSAFHGCSSLASINIPNSVTIIEDKTFSDCRKLTEIILPDSITMIGDHAFSGCGLFNITLPNSITVLEDGAFGDCVKITEIVLPKNITSIGEYAFTSYLKSVYYDGTLEDWCKIDFGGILGSDANIYFLDENGTIENNNKKYTSLPTNITVPNTIKEIKPYCFAYFKITEITFPNGVSSIGNNAFYRCNNLKTINIPASLTKIETNAFYNCYNLTTFYYNGTIEDWCKIDLDYANPVYINSYFYILDENGTIENNNKKYSLLTSIEIPDTIKEIKASAFECFNVSSVTISNSVTSIGDFAFSHCTALTTINFNGTKEQWSQITKGELWNYKVPATVVHCTDGDVDLTA